MRPFPRDSEEPVPEVGQGRTVIWSRTIGSVALSRTERDAGLDDGLSPVDFAAWRRVIGHDGPFPSFHLFHVSVRLSGHSVFKHWRSEGFTDELKGYPGLLRGLIRFSAGPYQRNKKPIVALLNDQPPYVSLRCLHEGCGVVVYGQRKLNKKCI